MDVDLKEKDLCASTAAHLKRMLLESIESDRELSGSEYQALRALLTLQQVGVLPSKPWDAITIKKEICLREDFAFGGAWKIKEQEFVYVWKNSEGVQFAEVVLTMRGEIPDVSPENLLWKRAQRRWFVGRLRISKKVSAPPPDSNEVIDDMGLKVVMVEEAAKDGVEIDVESKDDVMKLVHLIMESRKLQ